MESPSVEMWRFLKRESCHTESNAFCTSTVATNVSLDESLLFDNTSEHTSAAIPGDSFSVKPNCSGLCGARRVDQTLATRTCSRTLPMTLVIVIPLWFPISIGSLPFLGIVITSPQVS